MQFHRNSRFLAMGLSVVLHALVLAVAGHHLFESVGGRAAPRRFEAEIVRLESAQPAAAKKNTSPAPQSRAVLPAKRPPAREATPVLQDPARLKPPPGHRPASMDAPPAPSAEEWSLAAKYTLKNSKRYRYTWGQQVRSMMGTAVEGPDQGAVRFAIEIAANGTVTRVETLWATSAVAEQRARKAIASMPPLPPTPTGQPLVFEKTISFQPYATDFPPIYADDCLPDPPSFRNPFAWDGKSPQGPVAPMKVAKSDPKAIDECRKQLPEDSIEAVTAHDKREIEGWQSSRIGG